MLYNDPSASGGLFNKVRHSPRRPNEWAELPHATAFVRPGFVAPSSESFYRALEVAKSSHLAPSKAAVIEGLSKGSIATRLRQIFTAFGSPWQGLGAGPELGIADGNASDRHHRRDDQAAAYRLTPGQTFDVLDTGVDVSRVFQGAGSGFQGGGGPITWPVAAFAGLDVAISAGTAKQGEMPGRVAGAVGAQTTGLLSWYVGGSVGAVAGGVVGSIAGEAVGGPLGSKVGTLAGAFVGRWSTRIGSQMLLDPMVRKIGNPINRLIAGSQGRVKFGGFQDSYPAFTMRQRALREMQNSLLNATQYIGREAQLMHQ